MSQISELRKSQTQFQAQALSWKTGSEITGLDLSDEQAITDTVIEDLHHLAGERGFILFRNQNLTHDQHLAFTRRFGPLADTGGIGRFAPPGYPDLFRLTNQKIDGKRSETIGSAIQWHSDQSFMPQPAMGSLLYCVKAPRLGGNTMFANMTQAFAGLSEGFQHTLIGLQAVHNPFNTRGIQVRTLTPPSEADRAKMKGCAHPVVIKHPLTGKPALYVSDMLVDHFEGWAVEESKPVLDFLHTHATQPAYTYRHSWRPGDLIFWDNRCVMHYTPQDYDITAMDEPENERLMFRSTLQGHSPIAWTGPET